MIYRPLNNWRRSWKTLKKMHEGSLLIPGRESPRYRNVSYRGFPMLWLEVSCAGMQRMSLKQSSSNVAIW